MVHINARYEYDVEDKNYQCHEQIANAIIMKMWKMFSVLHMQKMLQEGMKIKYWKQIRKIGIIDNFCAWCIGKIGNCKRAEKIDG